MKVLIYLIMTGGFGNVYPFHVDLYPTVKLLLIPLLTIL